MPGTTNIDLSWDDVEAFAYSQEVASEAAATIGVIVAHQRLGGDRWDATRYIIAAETIHYGEGTAEWKAPRRHLSRIAALLDTAHMEADTGAGDTTPWTAKNGTAYTTVLAIDEAYAELGHALEAWKASLR